MQHITTNMCGYMCVCVAIFVTIFVSIELSHIDFEPEDNLAKISGKMQRTHKSAVFFYQKDQFVHCI